MKTATYTIRFTTPAFLGNAEQSGQWRTPAIKALLRQWWRVAVAQECKYNIVTLREREDALFGSVEGKAHKSKVRIRLSRWDSGQMRSWQGLDKTRVPHPEVKDKKGESVSVGAHLYLGYGPLEYQNGTALKKKTVAIAASEAATFSLAFPDEHAEALTTALWLMHQYGTLGGRSRNGWGSFSLTENDGTPALTGGLTDRLTQDWQDALAPGFDWPHAIGTNEGKPLIWQTPEYPDWNSVMAELAKLKIGLRTQFKFHGGKDSPAPEARHWLSYPVTHHSVKPWGGNARLPNSLRFKVREVGKDKLVGVIFHVPCLPPASFRPDRAAIETVWRSVHAFLDDHDQNLARLPA